jgi:hypothetical protein
MKGGVLVHGDDSGIQFQQEMLKGNPSAAINFDCIMYHPIVGATIFELLQVSAEAQEMGITPYNSHPNRYWFKNKLKFISLWNYMQDARGSLILVNYAPKGTKCEDMVGILKVLDATDDGLSTRRTEWSREQFSDWYINYNKRCREFEANRHVRKIVNY